MKSLGYVNSVFEPNLWEKPWEYTDVFDVAKQTFIMLMVYVDGFYFFGIRKCIAQAREELHKHIKLKHTQPERKGNVEISDFAGLKIIHSLKTGNILLSMADYAEKIAKEHAQLMNKLHVPITRRIDESEAKREEDGGATEKKVQKVSGECIWLMLMGRPDLAFPISHATQRPASKGAERVLTEVAQYLKIPKVQLMKRGENPHGENSEKNGKVTIVGMSDSDHNRGVDGKSQYGHTVSIGKSLITWRSGRLNCVTTSPHDSEMSAGCKATKATMRVKNIVASYALGRQYVETEEAKLLLDSQSNVKMNNSDVIPQKSKHNRLAQLYMREMHIKKEITTQYIPRRMNHSDICTHETNANELEAHLRGLGIAHAGIYNENGDF